MICFLAELYCIILSELFPRMRIEQTIFVMVVVALATKERFLLLAINRR